MIKDKTLHIISCGPGLSEINEKHGRSCDWIRQIIGDRVQNVNIVNVYDGVLPSCKNDDVWVIMGSRYSVYNDINWIDTFRNHIKTGIKKEIPMLGICFGHQIIGSALGARVVNNDKGWDLGSSEIELTKEGQNSILFKGFKSKFLAYESHHDVLIDLPANVSLLAKNKYGIQSFSYSDFIFGVQFHPEFDFKIMKAYYNARIQKIENYNNYYLEDKNDGLKVIDNL